MHFNYSVVFLWKGMYTTKDVSSKQPIQLNSTTVRICDFPFFHGFESNLYIAVHFMEVTFRLRIYNRIWAWSWCPANLLHHKMIKKMHFESHIFQVKRDLTDTSLVTLCHTIGKKIVPMLYMRKKLNFACHLPWCNSTPKQICYCLYFVSVLYFS